MDPFERIGLPQGPQQLRDYFGQALLEVCKLNEQVIVLDGDLGNSTMAHTVKEAFPDRFYNIGIAESNLVGIAAGLASCGFIPFATSFPNFLLCNAFDQLRLSVSIAALNVKVVGSHGGVSTNREGPSSMSIEDFALVSALPPFVIIAPSDGASMHKAVHAAVVHNGPVYIRSSRIAVPEMYKLEDMQFEIGKAISLRTGTDVTIVACGIMVAVSLYAADILEKQGIYASVLDMHTIRPIDQDAIVAAAKTTGAIVVAEEHLVHGGLGTQVAQLVAETEPVPIRFIGFRNTYAVSGSVPELMEKYGLTAEHVASASREVILAKETRVR